LTESASSTILSGFAGLGNRGSNDDLQSGSLMKLAQTFTTTQKQMCVDEFGDEQKCGDAVIVEPERENKL
jgi:hypothetical protein